jgi:XisI protein
MDTRTLCNAAEAVLIQYRDYVGDNPETTIALVIDPERDRYLLVEHGWDGDRRIYGTMIHLDVIDRQIWIQHDGTETGVAYDLMALGIPSDRLVLAYKSPERRKIAQLTP